MSKLLVAGAATVFALMAGCGGNGMTQGSDSGTQSVSAIPQSGFLSDYSKLKPVDGAEGTYRYIDTTAKLRPYTKVMIDPVQIFVTQNPEYQGLQPDALKRMTDTFQTAFIGALVSGYQIVNQPGPDVLRLRLAITGVQPVKPGLSASDFIPIKALFNLARDASGGAPQVAEISAEMEVLEMNGHVVAAAVSSRKGDKTLPQGASITWNDLQSIVAVWAKNLRQGLDYARGYAEK